MKSIFQILCMILEGIQDAKKLRAETRTKHFRIV